MAFGLSLLMLGLLSCSGCHRQYYRKQADLEAHFLIAEKASHVARPPNIPIQIEVDRRSRMFNPFDPDYQPMPLDDPASYQYMQCVDGRRGYPMWEGAGITNTAESPDWWQFLPLNEDGILVLDADTAVRIALINSPDYQFQVEQLYLSALAVSAERFQFDTQFFGRTGMTFTRDGDLRGVVDPLGSGAQSGSTRFGLEANRVPSSLSLQRNFASGGTLIAGIANSLVWELSGPNTQSATTLVDFTLLQPLLRAAGRDVVMENLTASERALLANVRSFERFRRSFYLNVTVGRGIENRVQLGGGILAVGGIGFSAGGFLGLLQSELQIRNSEENITRQTENLLLLEDSLIESLTTIPDDAGGIVQDRLQVAQARSRLLASQSQLVGQQAGFQRSVDQFMAALGLPPYICVKLDDPILDQFELIDRQLLTRNEELSELRAKVGEINVSILEGGEYRVDPDTGVPASYIEWTEELAEKLRDLRTEIDPLVKFTKDLIESDLPVIAQDIEYLSESVPERQSQSQSLYELYQQEQKSECGLLNLSQIDESIFVVDQLTGLSAELQDSHAELQERLESYKDRIEKLDDAFTKLLEQGPALDDPQELAEQLREEIVLASQDLVAELGDDVLTLQLIQARARTESVFLPEVDIDPPTAIQIARKNRRDWANARAALVDVWRSIEVVADDLESDLDLELSGEVRNVGNNPLNLRSSDGQIRVGLRWDAPLTRLLERNAYRASLIEYERTKRDYYQFEDGVWQTIRAEIRQLLSNRLTFELGRQAVSIAAQQIELTADRRALDEARGRPSGPTAARDVIDALAALLDAQNQLLNIFVSYEVVRRSLDFDLGTMELTPEGLWIDPGAISTEILLGLPGTTDGGMIGGQCNKCCLPNMPFPVEPEYGPQLELAPMILLDESSGMLESDQDSAHDPDHVASLPSAEESETQPAIVEAAPVVAGPKVNILPNADVEAVSP
jgi:hypothetical protein